MRSGVSQSEGPKRSSQCPSAAKRDGSTAGPPRSSKETERRRDRPRARLVTTMPEQPGADRRRPGKARYARVMTATQASCTTSSAVPRERANTIASRTAGCGARAPAGRRRSGPPRAAARPAPLRNRACASVDRFRASRYGSRVRPHGSGRRLLDADARLADHLAPLGHLRAR
jgi:hypothetical protein